MKTSIVVVGLIAALALGLSISGLVGGNNQSFLGGYTNFDELELNGAGTTTIKFNGPTAGSGSCIQFENQNGDTVKVYVAGSATTSLTVASGTCK